MTPPVRGVSGLARRAGLPEERLGPIRRFILAAVMAAFLVLPATAHAHARGCDSKACDKRVGKKVHWSAAGATTYGGPLDYGTPGHTGYCWGGVNLDDLPMSFAELGNGHGLGSLPCGAKLRVLVPSTGRRLTLVRRDIGFGGGPIAGLPRLIDIWHTAAAALGVGHVWSGKVLYRLLQ